MNSSGEDIRLDKEVNSIVNFPNDDLKYISSIVISLDILENTGHKTDGIEQGVVDLECDSESNTIDLAIDIRDENDDEYFVSSQRNSSIVKYLSYIYDDSLISIRGCVQ